MQEHCQKLERELEATSFFRMNQSHGALPARRSIGLPPVAGRSGEAWLSMVRRGVLRKQYAHGTKVHSARSHTQSGTLRSPSNRDGITLARLATCDQSNGLVVNRQKGAAMNRCGVCGQGDDAPWVRETARSPRYWTVKAQCMTICMEVCGDDCGVECHSQRTVWC